MENQKNKHKSFRITFFKPTDPNKKWWQFNNIDTREYGYTAILGIMAGIVFQRSLILGPIFSIAGIYCGVMWIIRKIMKK